MIDLTIRQIVEKVQTGQLRIPAFQRGFVWAADHVAYLMDSIYKGYPFGAILLWHTKEKLLFDRKLGPFKLPDAAADYPVDYILDGQQRVTSIFGVFQTDIEEDDPEDWSKIYFDFIANPDAQESQFLALNDSDVDPARHFLLKNLFDVTAYRKATKDFDDDIAKKIDHLQSVFKEARIPVQQITTENRTTVAIVFERVNQRGVELDTLQLLSAWTWSEDFDLHTEFKALANDLESFGFEDVGLDTNLLLRCCAAVIAHDATTAKLVSLNGSVVRGRFEEVVNGIKGAIDFLRTNLEVHALSSMPYTTFLIPLSVFFAHVGNAQVLLTDAQREVIVRWFWRTCFSKRYNSQPAKTLQDDIVQILALKRGEASTLDEIAVSVDAEFFKTVSFRMNSVSTKTFISLLAQHKPLSFVSGSPITMKEVLRDYNKTEFHHLFTRSYLKSSNQNVYDHSCLANFSFLSRVDNNKLSGDAPSEYRRHMPANTKEILARAICPESLFEDNYKVFIDERAQLLANAANKLLS